MRSCRFASLRVSYDLRTGAFRMPAYIEITPDEFIENPALKYLEAAADPPTRPMELRVIEGGPRPPTSEN